jgi:pentatricopeptide repeat protein
VQKLVDQREAALAKTLPATFWSDFMEACLSRGEDQKARWVYNDMIRYGIPPNPKCKKMFSDLQLKGGTTDRGGPDIARAKTTVEQAEATARKEEASSILSALFNRHTKPAMSS